MFYMSHRPINVIGPADEDSIEMKTAEMLSGVDGNNIFHFTTTDDYSSLKLYITEYRKGNLINKSDMVWEYGDVGSPENGTILIAPDSGNSLIKVIMAGDQGKASAEVPILEDASDREAFGKVAGIILDNMEIRYNHEQPLMALAYNRDGISSVEVWDVIKGKAEALTKNEYVYYFSFEFCK